MRAAIILLVAFAATAASADNKAKFTEHEVVPDVIDEAPEGVLTVSLTEIF